MPRPLVAIVGRPNVGKSTLFNRLAGERLAVVDEVPGTTRDRLVAEADWNGVYFDLVDTGGIDPTGSGPGLRGTPLSVGSAEFIEGIRYQAEIAVREADLVIFMVDVGAGITPADEEVAEILRRLQVEKDGRSHPPVLLAVNKTDSQKRMPDVYEFYRLGMGDPYPISAQHGTGTGDLLDAVVTALDVPPEESEEEDSIKIGIVGKPNAGKSTLLNRLVGSERALVSPIPGTTRDAVDTRMVYEDIPITLIDTAGIRKRGKIEPGVEKYSVLRAHQAIQRSDVVLLVVDAEQGITAQDQHIAGFIIDAWKSVVVVVNKWDAISKDAHTMYEFTAHVREQLNFLDFVPVLFISAKTGQRVDQVLAQALVVQEERLVRIPTSQINRLLRDAQDRHPAPSKAGKHLKIYYGTQVRSEPPTFMLFVNHPELVHFTYMRYLENRFREEYHFIGTPIRIVMKARREE
ncbi:MAG TPA: ribosome biogenesis GTPase Der [Anaerolineales bacterium]|nr:ribosome biogenesis GTPase Der [Anaerolineales bacterium]